MGRIEILEFLDGNRAVIRLDGLFRVQTLHRGVVLAELMSQSEAENEARMYNALGRGKIVAKRYSKLNEREKSRRHHAVRILRRRASELEKMIDRRPAGRRGTFYVIAWTAPPLCNETTGPPER